MRKEVTKCKNETIGLDVKAMGIPLLAEDEVFMEFEEGPYYWISNYGRVLSFSNKEAKIMKPKNDKLAKLRISLRCYNGDGGLEYKQINLDTMVARIFLRSYEPGTIIIHCDGDKRNNYYRNLICVARKESNKLRKGLISMEELRKQYSDIYKTDKELLQTQQQASAIKQAMKDGGQMAGKLTRDKAYRAWLHMKYRCSSENFQKKYPTYSGCSVCPEWEHDFDKFYQWAEENYYTVGWGQMDLDKDILVKGNKVYGPDTCCFVPHSINAMFVISDGSRGNLPVGVFESGKKYQAGMTVDYKKKIYFGSYDTPEEAFAVYKRHKEAWIMSTADRFKDKLPKRLYEAMINWKIEITD